MKVGMIFECGPDGADKKVCEHLARKIQPEIEIVSITLSNKPGLIAECGKNVSQLLGDGCEHIVIVWDLFPAWRERGQHPCRKDDCNEIRRSLTEAGVSSTNVYLVCIEEELEAWLLADGRAISTVLSKPHRQVRVGHENNPEQIRNPKKRLNNIFQNKTGRTYIDRMHAEQIVRALPDLTRIRRCSTFARFERKVKGGLS